MKTISSLSPELTKLLFDAGSRAIVLVEGDQDRNVLREWFKQELAEIEFFACGGIKQIERLYQEFFSASRHKRVFAITDRDFRSDEEVEASYAEGSHVFILRRYALENYLVEPKPLLTHLLIWKPNLEADFPDEQAIESRLLEICRELKSIVAANWIFYGMNAARYQSTGETEKLQYFSNGFDKNRQVVINGLSAKLQCPAEEAERLIAEQEQVVEQYLSSLNRAHSVVDGKRLLHWIHHGFFNIPEEYLFRLLIHEAEACGLPRDIVMIVRERILVFAREN